MEAPSWDELIESDDVERLRKLLVATGSRGQSEFLRSMRDILERRLKWGCPDVARTLTATCDDVPEVLELLQALVSRETAEALDFLGAVEEFPSRRTLPLVTGFLDHADPLVRVCAVDAIAAIGDLRSAATLREMFTVERDALVRAHLPAALVSCVVLEIRALAAAVFADEDARVRRHGGFGLLALMDIVAETWPETVEDDEEATSNLVEWMWCDLPELRSRLDSLVARVRDSKVAERYARLKAARESDRSEQG
ncbi:MAG: HEAT repeat domain-containing protein [Deltaproteobacteria bacterium]|nr:HEAT repeat domain-containing protein [Myxococcales bacterium]MDP3221055.1 HEAT repeat domain-containing protein [Deltaproteobacteria bacterium]